MIYSYLNHILGRYGQPRGMLAPAGRTIPHDPATAAIRALPAPLATLAQTTHAPPKWYAAYRTNCNGFRLSRSQ